MDRLLWGVVLAVSVFGCTGVVVHVSGAVVFGVGVGGGVVQMGLSSMARVGAAVLGLAALKQELTGWLGFCMLWKVGAEDFIYGEKCNRSYF